jgi:hypothetical protein
MIKIDNQQCFFFRRASIFWIWELLSHKIAVFDMHEFEQKRRGCKGTKDDISSENMLLTGDVATISF